MNDKYSSQIHELDEKLLIEPNNYELFYERGYFHFLSNNDELSKADYHKAVSLGLDITVFPYYCFSDSNTKRREFLLPEKILVFLVLIMVLFSIVLQLFYFLSGINFS